MICWRRLRSPLGLLSQLVQIVLRDVILKEKKPLPMCPMPGPIWASILRPTLWPALCSKQTALSDLALKDMGGS
jgi:hypothetical protein